jgi:Na+-transporting methylmalonyl-CoA/oxaloacetate decarboxylase gamma subunit
MLTVFLFLGVLVLAMVLLRAAVTRFLPDRPDPSASTVVAVAVAAAHEQQKKGNAT